MNKSLGFLSICISLICVSAPAAAQSVKDPACVAKLSDMEKYKQEKKTSYELLVPGENDWIYRSQTDFTDNFVWGDQAIKGLKAFSDALKAKDIDLVIAYQPTRGMVAAENLPKDNKLSANFDPVKATANYKASIEKMQAQGIHFLGITDFAKNEGYFRKMDQHWNASGAKKTAEVVAAYVKENLPVYKKLHKAEFETVSGGEYEFDGRFNEVVHDFCGFDLPKEKDVDVTTSIKGDGGGALFGDMPPPEVVLVGTSNSKSAVFNANFDGALKQALGTDVHNAAIAGINYDFPMLAYLNSKEYKENPPKLIVWEIPGYYVLKNEDEFFSQAIAAVYGDCGKDALASFGPVAVDKGRVDLLEGLAAKNIANGTDYVALHFNEPVKKHFAVFFGYNDEKKSRKRFKFKRTSRFPYDGDFYVTTPANKKDKIDTLAVGVPDELKGMTVEGKLCRLPSGVSGL